MKASELVLDVELRFAAPMFKLSLLASLAAMGTTIEVPLTVERMVLDLDMKILVRLGGHLLSTRKPEPQHCF